MARHFGSRQSPGGELHHERGVVGEGCVLPRGDAPWVDAVIAHRQPGELRVPSLETDISARRVVDERGVLVVPDADRWLQASDQAVDGT